MIAPGPGDRLKIAVFHDKHRASYDTLYQENATPGDHRLRLDDHAHHLRMELATGDTGNAFCAIPGQALVQLDRNEGILLQSKQHIRMMAPKIELNEEQPCHPIPPQRIAPYPFRAKPLFYVMLTFFVIHKAGKRRNSANHLREVTQPFSPWMRALSAFKV